MFHNFIQTKMTSNNVCLNALCKQAREASDYQIKKLQKDLETTKEFLAIQKEKNLAMRREYLKETTNLKDIINGRNSQNESDAVKEFRTCIQVKYFDDLEGLDANIILLLNDRIARMKEIQEEELLQKNELISQMKKKIEILDKLQSETLPLMNMKIETLFKGIAAIHYHAFPVFKALLDAYPKDHFRLCMKEALQGGQRSGIISKFREQKYKVEITECIRLNDQKLADTIEYYRKKFEWAEDIKTTCRDQIIKERESHELELNRVISEADLTAKEFIKSEQIRQTVFFESKYQRQQQELLNIRQENLRFQEIARSNDTKFAFQKWLMLARVEKFMFSTMNIPEQREELYKMQARAEILGNHDALNKLANSYNEELKKSSVLQFTNTSLEKRITDIRAELDQQKQQNQLLACRVETKTAQWMALYENCESAKRAALLSELQVNSLKKEIGELQDMLELQKSIRENLERKFGLFRHETGIMEALKIDEQEDNEIDCLFRMLKSDLRAVQAQQTLKQLKQQINLTQNAKRRKETSVQTEIVCINRTFYLVDDGYSEPNQDQMKETQTEMRGNLIDYSMKSTLQFLKMLDEGIFAFKKPPNIDLDIINGHLQWLIGLGLQSQGADQIAIDHIGIASAIQQCQNWQSKPQKSSPVKKFSSLRNLNSYNASQQNGERSADSVAQQNETKVMNIEDVPELTDTDDEQKKSSKSSKTHSQSQSQFRLKIQHNDTIMNSRKIQERKLAEDTFQAYIELIELIQKLDPKLFKAAITTIKNQLYENIDFSTTTSLHKQHADLIPDVFLRLWETRKEPKTIVMRREILQKAKKELVQNLQAQNLLDLPAQNPRVVISSSSSKAILDGGRSSSKSKTPEIQNTQLDRAQENDSQEILNFTNQYLLEKRRTRTAGQRNRKKAISTLHKLAKEQMLMNNSQNEPLMKMRKSTYVLRSNRDIIEQIQLGPSAQMLSQQSQVNSPQAVLSNLRFSSALSLTQGSNSKIINQSNTPKAANISRFGSTNQRRILDLKNVSKIQQMQDFVASQQHPDEYQGSHEQTTENFVSTQKSDYSPIMSRRRSNPIYQVARYKTSQLQFV